MLEINTWMNGFLKILNGTFENRVWFAWSKNKLEQMERT